jgi:methionine-rich copper-binding protein CopC
MTFRITSTIGLGVATIKSKRIVPGILLGLLLVQNVFAHARYERSQPGEGAIVAVAPGRVEIWFSQELFRRQGENWIRIFGPDGAAVHSGQAKIDDDDRSHMWVDLQQGLTAGEYRVNWRNLSAEDGDTDEGAFTFTVDPQAEATSTPMLANRELAVATATTPPLASPTVAAQAPEDDSAGSGCFPGLLPLVGLVALAGMAAGKVKR